MSGLAPERLPPGALRGSLDLLRCPRSGQPLVVTPAGIASQDGAFTYRVSENGIPLFAEAHASEDARKQQAHYDRIAAAYLDNLAYPHTVEYTRYLDRAFLAELDPGRLGTAAELCCGRGEAFHLIGAEVGRGVGVDISLKMLDAAAAEHRDRPQLAFVQGDATALPLASGAFDSVLMLGGIHHVNDRKALFSEVFRILRPGGAFYFREPCSDFLPWRALRAIIYRLSPALDHESERPLLREETVPVLEGAGFRLRGYSTHGFLGFCFLMNSDVLVFNRVLRFLPGIRALTRVAARFDALVLGLPGLRGAGLQVIGSAVKPEAG
jgi:ubiquinone/menaquinone biosynthesis C-methylase UbiE